jgi:phytoene synthase
MTPDQYCQEKGAPGGSSTYYSLRFLPADQRRAVFALQAFRAELAGIAGSPGEAVIAQRKLDWWHEEIDASFADRPNHPVTRALQPALERYNLPAEYFHEVIDGMAMDLHRQRYADFSELALYCQRVAGVISLMSTEVFGYRKRETLKYAETLGTALQLTRILRDARLHADHGRVYFPLDELHAHGLDPEALPVAGDALRELLALQGRRARDYFMRALTCLPEQDRYSQRSGLVLSAIHQALLTEIEADGYRVMERRLALTPLRKLWIAWTVNMHERRRHRKLKE